MSRRDRYSRRRIGPVTNASTPKWRANVDWVDARVPVQQHSRSGSVRLARRADPVEFDDVAQVAVAESFADVVGPLLELRRVDLHGRAAEATRQVVVVGRRRRSVDRDSRRDRSSRRRRRRICDEFLELGVDGREGDLAAVALDEGVEVLGAHETLDLARGPR